MDNNDLKKLLINKADDKMEIIRNLTNELIENFIELRTALNELRFLKVLSEDINSTENDIHN